MFCFSAIDVSPAVRFAKKRRPVLDLARKHLASHSTFISHYFDLPVDSEIVFLMIPLKQPAEFVLHDSANSADANIALFG